MKITYSLLLGLLLTALTASKPAEKANLITGTYGVYHSNNNPVMIELKINDDFTFHYINNSNPAKPVNTKGNWKLKSNTIVLDNYKSEFPINSEWTIDKNQPCLKSRNALNFTRICLLNK